jgi:hypothetical protein
VHAQRSRPANPAEAGQICDFSRRQGMDFKPATIEKLSHVLELLLQNASHGR